MVKFWMGCAIVNLISIDPSRPAIQPSFPLKNTQIFLGKKIKLLYMLTMGPGKFAAEKFTAGKIRPAEFSPLEFQMISTKKYYK